MLQKQGLAKAHTYPKRGEQKENIQLNSIIFHSLHPPNPKKNTPFFQIPWSSAPSSPRPLSPSLLSSMMSLGSSRSGASKESSPPGGSSPQDLRWRLWLVELFVSTSTPQQVVSSGLLIGKRLPKTTCWGVLVFSHFLLMFLWGGRKWNVMTRKTDNVMVNDSSQASEIKAKTMHPVNN